MNVKKNFIFHQKSKSISNKLSLKEIDFDNNLINGQSNNNNNIYINTLKNKNTSINEDREKNKNKEKNNKQDEKTEEINFVKTIDEMNQNVLDIYYDKNSSFKKKIDDLNLKFYL